jgi:DNA-directed RNA polymerase specialized sigma24 family protein
MARTFEELTGEGLDTLYQGALFLTGGHPEGAEHLLVEALTLAYRQSRGAEDPVAVRWLEAKLVRAFLAGASGSDTVAPQTSGAVGLDSSVLEEIGPEVMFLAAGTLPPMPRAALWLVLVQRWSYTDAADALDITTERLRDLLRYRDALLEALLRAPRRGDGVDPSSRAV